MKLALSSDQRIGVLTDAGFTDVSSVFADIRYRTAVDRMPRVLAALSARRGLVEDAAAAGSAEADVQLQSPVPRPPKLIACFGNYREGTDRARQTQDMFLESPESVIGPGGTVVLPPAQASIFHHEAELGLVIGSRAKDLPNDERALNALAGYTCAMDISGRGLGRMGPSRIGKSFDTFTPLGPAIVTPDEIADPQALDITLKVNGNLLQQYSTSDMEYSVIEILHFISGYMTLVPGDVLMCGTNHQGLGPVQNGDHVEMSIAGIGSLGVNVEDALGRSWERGIDREMADRVRNSAA